jgi:hypothetical protein
LGTLGGRTSAPDVRTATPIGGPGPPAGRRVLPRVATLITPDTILRWNPAPVSCARSVIWRLGWSESPRGATESEAPSKSRHRIARSTVAAILQADGIGPASTTDVVAHLCPHWDAFAGADFFTTEVWTVRGLVTHYKVFVIDLAFRRVQLLGSTPHPDDGFVRQVALTTDERAVSLGQERRDPLPHSPRLGGLLRYNHRAL